MRDENILALSVARPWMTAFGEELYKTPYQKGGAIAEAIISHHVFNDGNHRSALGAAYVVLGLDGLRLVAQKDDTLDAIRRLESKTITLDEFSDWLEQNCVLRLAGSFSLKDPATFLSLTLQPPS